MLNNNLKIALRSTLKNKLFASINILGLALGMTCCFLIILYWNHETNYDLFHEKLDRIYRVDYHMVRESGEWHNYHVPPPLAPKMKEDIPELEAVARLFSQNISAAVKSENGKTSNEFEFTEAYFADADILKILSFDFLSGDPIEALTTPFSVVLTEKSANQLFGRTDILGETVHLRDYPFEVTGVVKDYPDQSHLRFDLMAYYENMFDVTPAANEESANRPELMAWMKDNLLVKNWLITHSYTYALLKEGASIASANAAFKPLLERNGRPELIKSQNFSLIPLKGSHTRVDAGTDPVPKANLTFLYLFLTIGGLILLIAAINFVNFSTAGSLSRAREVGIRKVLGAAKSRIIGQFLGESLMLSSIAFLVALMLVQFGLPLLNSLTNLKIAFDPIQHLNLTLLFFGIFVLTGLLAGIYPAFFVTKFKPASVLAGKGIANVPKGVFTRKALIVIQFMAAMVMIAGTFGVYKQLEYLRNQPLGFEKNQMINIPIFSDNFNNWMGGIDGPFRQKQLAFEDELLKNPNIKATTASSQLPGFGGISDRVVSEKIKPEDAVYAPIVSVDYDFTETYNLELIAGRHFDKEFGTDHQKAVIINEKALGLLQYDSPEEALGKKAIIKNKEEAVIVGVLKDFHFNSLQYEIQPLFLHVAANTFNIFSVKVDNQNIPQTIDFIKEKWATFFPEKVFQYTFLEDSINEMYQSEDQLSTLISYFSLIAILIACFGLYGLVAYAAVQKTKEIGIRKVLGATVSNLVLLLSKDFLKLVFIGLVIATPVTWFLLTSWLQDYEYRMELGWRLFAFAGFVVIAIAFLTVSFQSVRAALANPVESLRSE